MEEIAVCIFGPTGIGKTALSIELAKKNGEIISVDSMQVYKFMDIGTAKPSPEQLKKVKHYLIDIITPDIQFTTGDFKRKAEECISNIIKSGKIPFLVGGTGLYFLSLTRGMIDIPKIDPAIREFIINKWNKLGQKSIYSILEKIDKEYAAMIHPNDKQRTLRAFEVIIGTGNKFSFYLKKNNLKNNTKYITLGIKIDRQKLYNMINDRVDIMISKGLIEEVKNLIKMGYNQNDPGMKAIGYKEIFNHLYNHVSLEKTIDEIKKNSRHYAKRQITWFNKLTDVKWFDSNEYNIIEDYINNKIYYFNK